MVNGWNWTSYLPSLAQPLEDAVDSIMTPVSQIKSQYRAVIKIGSSLYGDLTDLEPNKGYTILMSTPGTLVYPYGVVAFPDQAREKAAAMKAPTAKATAGPSARLNPMALKPDSISRRAVLR